MHMFMLIIMMYAGLLTRTCCPSTTCMCSWIESSIAFNYILDGQILSIFINGFINLIFPISYKHTRYT
jgi:hypothetical protein